MVDFSIIIPLFNQVAFTKVCHEYLMRNTEGDFELVFVDNASSDETPRFLDSLGGNVRIISNPANLGFAKACNQGARAAQGRYLVFLNNDTAVHQGWLSPLVEILRTRPETAIVGPKLLYPDHTIQQAGVVFGEMGLPYHLYLGSPSTLPGANKARFFRAVTGACFMISKRDFLAAGCFDERYLNGLEDIDLCLKIGEMEKGVFYNPASVVTHFESRSENRQAAMPRNKELFESRWCADPRQDDFCYLVQDGMEVMVNDRYRLEFREKAAADRIVSERIAEGLVFETSGDLSKALEHYRKIFTSAPNNALILSRIEELSLKIGLGSVAEHFRKRRNAQLEVGPGYGQDFRMLESRLARSV